MTPREHLALVLNYKHDFESELECVARLVDEPEQYWAHVEESLFNESMWINRACEDMSDVEDEDHLLEDNPQLLQEVEELIARAGGGS